MKRYMVVMLVAVLAGCEPLPCCQQAKNGSQCNAAEQGDLAGCAQQFGEAGPLAGAGCIGGSLDPTGGGPAGCTCMFVETTDPEREIVAECFSTNHPTGATFQQCADDAAAACCEAGAGTNC